MNKICVAAIILALLLTLIIATSGLNLTDSSSTKLGYATKLFDSSKVHTIDIKMDNWDSFIETCEDEEYVTCTVVVDEEAYKNVGIRAKGNTSLSSVAASGSDRYSFKIEFDHYQDGYSYYGLDKLSLNNIIQDNTYMKDYLTYQMMSEFGVDAPLSSYVYITVNGEDWGLYLAVEAVEESFLSRNYGNSYGELYKPDSLSMGGGSDKKMDFDASQMPNQGGIPEGFDPSQIANQGNMAENFDLGNKAGGFGGMGSDDVKLKYIDEDPDSYSNIFDNAKTDITLVDKKRLINSLYKLSKQEDLDSVVDIEEVIRYFVVHNFVCNSDSYTGSMIHNYYLYENDGKLSMIPWDYNLAFGSFQASSDATSTINDPIDSPLSTTSLEDRPMFSWIISNEEYTETYHQYFSEFIERYFSSGYLTQLIKDTKEMIAPYVQKDPSKFCTYEEFELGVAAIDRFCSLRAESIRGQLSGTIPATKTTQKEYSENLVDGSNVDISALGTMNFGGGGGFPNMRSMNKASDTDTSSSDSNVKDQTQSSSSDRTQDNLTQQPALSGSQGESIQPPSNGDSIGKETEQATSGDSTSGVTQNFSAESKGNRPQQGPMNRKQNKGDWAGFQSSTNVFNKQSINQSSMIEVIVSAVILVLGIMIAKKYKRVKN